MKLRSRIATLIALLSIGTVAIAAYVQPLGGSIFPLTYVKQPVVNLTDAYNEMLALINAQTAAGTNGVLNVGQAGAIISTSNIISSNPLVEATEESFAVASVNTSPAVAGAAVILSGVPSRTIYPTGALSLTAIGGNASGATYINVQCYPSGTLIASINAAQLVSGTPYSPFSGTGAKAGLGQGQGCSAGDGVVASAVGGALATSTSLLVNFPFFVQ